MGKISMLIVGMIIISFIAGTLGVILAGTSEEYSVSYDNSSLDAYNNLQELNNLTEEIHEKQKDIKEKTGVLDVIGGYFSSAYDALRITGKSINTFEDVASQGVEDASLGSTGGNLKTMIIAVMIVLVVMALLSAIMKWYL